MLDAPHFLRDFRRQSQIMDRGWLGFEHVGNGFWFNVTPNLTGAIGVVLVVLGVAGLGWALWRRTRLDLMVAPYVIVYFVYISTWKELADRYLLPIVPLLLLLAARLCVEAVGLGTAARHGASPSPVVAVVLAVGPRPAALGLGRVRPRPQRHGHARGGAGVDPAATCRPARSSPWRTTARRWCRRTPLDHYRAAGLDPVAYRVVRLKLPAPGTPDRSRDLTRLRRQGVEYVVVSSRVDDRVLAAPEVYPTVVAFYEQLDAEAQLVKEFRPGPGERGPVLKLYRLTGS